MNFVEFGKKAFNSLSIHMKRSEVSMFKVNIVVIYCVRDGCIGGNNLLLL